MTKAYRDRRKSWMLPSRRTLTAAMLLLWAGPSASWSAPAASAALRAGETRPVVAARAAGLTMALNLPQLGQRPGRGLIPGFLQPMPESIAEGDTRRATRINPPPPR